MLIALGRTKEAKGVCGMREVLNSRLIMLSTGKVTIYLILIESKTRPLLQAVLT